ncbi:hypothetical protein JTB14_013238 [Gonioctena quinquepunctata]|nr:hypothetical protein JTB14_013238 [Gonioctena quinquepunctata]
MFIPIMEKYDQLKDILDQQKIPYHTYNKSDNRQIIAIFKGVAEDIDPTAIVNELVNKGYHPRVVARFKFRDGKPMPIILVIVPNYETGIKDVTTICQIQVTFEHQKRRKRLGQCYNCQRFEHSASNSKADPICRHCAGTHESREQKKDEHTQNTCINCGDHTNLTIKDVRTFPRWKSRKIQKGPQLLGKVHE